MDDAPAREACRDVLTLTTRQSVLVSTLIAWVRQELADEDRPRRRRAGAAWLQTIEQAHHHQTAELDAARRRLEVALTERTT